MRVCLRNFSLRFKKPAPATRNKVESHKSNNRQLDTARCITLQSQIFLDFYTNYGELRESKLENYICIAAGRWAQLVELPVDNLVPRCLVDEAKGEIWSHRICNRDRQECDRRWKREYLKYILKLAAVFRRVLKTTNLIEPWSFSLPKRSYTYWSSMNQLICCCCCSVKH